MSEEKDVALSQQKQALLEKLRASKGNTDNDTRTDTEKRRGHTPSAIIEVSGTYGSPQGYSGGIEAGKGRTVRRAEGTQSIEGASHGYDTSSGQTLTTDIHSFEEPSRDSKRPSQDNGPIIPLRDGTVERDDDVTDNVTDERRKELNAQRQKRHRERQKQAQIGAVSVTDSVTPKFTLKNLLPGNHTAEEKPVTPTEKKPEVKLISNTEAGSLLDELTFIYQHGSGLIDDILEIVVNGHDEVTIWQLDEDEARLLAKMHLERGRVDKAAAASARKLVGLYDKISLFMMIGPRAIATTRHVTEHGGFSIK